MVKNRFDLAHYGDTIVFKFNGVSILMSKEEALAVSEGLKEEAHLSMTEEVYEDSFSQTCCK